MNQAETQVIISRTISKYLNPNETYIFLFGSRVGGEVSRASDYDVGIFNGSKISLGTIGKIKAELEDYSIPVDIDIIDFSTVTEEFKKIALNKIEIWNKPKKNLKLI